MATRTVLLQFSAGSNHFNHTHEVPVETLNKSTFQANIDIFNATMEGIKSKHHLEFSQKCGSTCHECPQPTFGYILHPMSFLHLPHDPYLYIEVIPLCANPKCKLDALVHKGEIGRRLGVSCVADSDVCVVCEKEEDLMRCAKCKKVWYCGE
jgi:hypothetical protein